MCILQYFTSLPGTRNIAVYLSFALNVFIKNNVHATVSFHECSYFLFYPLDLKFLPLTVVFWAENHFINSLKQRSVASVVWNDAKQWTQLWVETAEEYIQWKKVESSDSLGGVVPSLPPPTFFFPTSWATDGRTCWPKMLRRRGDRGAKLGKKKLTDILNEKQSLLVYLGTLGESFLFPNYRQVCLETAFGFFQVIDLCVLSIWHVCLRGSWNGFGQIVRGKVMRILEDVRRSGKVGAGRVAGCVLHVEWSPSCSCVPFRSFRSWMGGMALAGTWSLWL